MRPPTAEPVWAFAAPVKVVEDAEVVDVPDLPVEAAAAPLEAATPLPDATPEPDATTVATVVGDPPAAVVLMMAVPLLPTTDVADAVATERTEDPTPLPPLPWDGVRPEPLETALVAARAAEEASDDAEEPVEAGAEVDEEAELVELVTLEQDRSYRGVVLKVEPTIPNDGFGVLG